MKNMSLILSHKSHKYINCLPFFLKLVWNFQFKPILLESISNRIYYLAYDIFLFHILYILISHNGTFRTLDVTFEVGIPANGLPFISKGAFFPKTPPPEFIKISFFICEVPVSKFKHLTKDLRKQKKMFSQN